MNNQTMQAIINDLRNLFHDDIHADVTSNQYIKVYEGENGKGIMYAVYVRLRDQGYKVRLAGDNNNVMVLE